MNYKNKLAIIIGLFLCFTALSQKSDNLKINDKNYFTLRGLDVMVFEDIYPEGHQGGVGIIQNGERVATNGDLRLEPTPGQWQPIPKVGKRTVNKEGNEISVNLWYPDTNINRKGFNPVFYPDLILRYKVRVKSVGESIVISVDLDKPIPAEWIGKIGFNMELYPTVLFGKTWLMDNTSGLFTRQPNGPAYRDMSGENQATPLATGHKLTIVPEKDEQRITFESKTSNLELIDGRIKHTNGWFVVRSAAIAGATTNAIEWTITANRIKDYTYKPVVHVSQVGYHPQQSKNAVIETDTNDITIQNAVLMRVTENGVTEELKKIQPTTWGKFLRYNYLQFNFSEVTKTGTYIVKYGNSQSNPFVISDSIYNRHVWQPTLEYFLPVQMCHMRVNDVYRVWHGVCHIDDALMAPTDTNHFDGYMQGLSTLTKYKPQERVPGLNRGGWHDAGDDDLRIESQAGTVYLLSLAYDEFKPEFDATTIDQAKRLVEIHQPDGKPDMLQQIEHGVLSILGGYENMGRVYRGIICPTLSQYTMVGDVSNQTNNIDFNPKLTYNGTFETSAALADDRLVFTEENAAHEFNAIQGLAAAARVLKDYNPELAGRCLIAAEALWRMPRKIKGNWHWNEQVKAAVELLITTKNKEYVKFFNDSADRIIKDAGNNGWFVARAISYIQNEKFAKAFSSSLAGLAKEIELEGKETPFGVPYRPHIWGAGWGIQEFGVRQYYLSKYYPHLFSKEHMFNALNFVLGCHPGINTASFASGVGAKSATMAYGYNRADWSYIPGGVVSGTSLIRPDFPELKEFPFLWQQTEYVLGGGESNFLFLVLAVNKVLKN